MATVASYDSYAGFMSLQIVNQTPPEASFMREYYRLLKSYYLQNGLYDYINQQMKSTKTTNDSLKGLRNPAWRVAEFYAAKLFPGKLPKALPMEAEKEVIIPAIQQMWEWSNFSATKQRWARWFAIYGDWYIKIQTKTDSDQKISSVYMSLLKPEYVTKHVTDERGYLTYIRIDVPIWDEEEDEVSGTYTEEWDKETQIVRIWNSHDVGIDAKIEEMPKPDVNMAFEQSHGANFIPIVYQPFRDDGGGRASGAYSAQLDKIDESNRQATRLAQILFRYNKALWAATSSGADATGRPLPPISMDGILEDDGTLKFGDDDVLALPSRADLKSLVPTIDYSAALSILQDQMLELEKDLPELAYYSLRGSLRDVTGRAVMFLLDDMISRVNEVRGNAETALHRAHEMALTVGMNAGVFSGLGTFEDGSFKHTFIERPILPRDMLELATITNTFALAGATTFAAGKAAGMTDEEATELADVGNFEEEIGGR